MGVPGFFGWLLRQYKDKKMMIPIVENITHFYVDANCLLHPQCFKILEHCPDTFTKKKLENMMMKRICNYVSYIFEHVNPTEEFYFSIDGVAPDAKMSQQRKRRIRANDDKEIKNNIKKKYNIPISNHDWSNTSITPGTVFMEQLHEHLLSYFKKLKEKHNDIKITYSSYHTEGEGEHKIMQNIRKKLKSSSSFQDKNIVIYGLDADLIFLSMACNKNNMYLLRESHQLKMQNNTNIPILDPVIDVHEQLTYVSIDITKKCYFEQINNIIIQKMNENMINDLQIDETLVINDFIVLCFLLGNDFLPHIPSIDIKRNGLDMLLDAYVDTLINFRCLTYLVDLNYKLDKAFLANILHEMTLIETKYFKIIKPKIDVRIGQRNICQSENPYDKEIWNIDNLKCFKIDDPIQIGKGKSEDWKFKYYEHYFGTSTYESQNRLINNMCEEYLRGIYWVTKYYFEGCHNWAWRYEYPHAPFISDIFNYIDNCNTEPKYEKHYSFRDDAVLPFTQLLCVLPSFCVHELPDKLKPLMTDMNSPLIDLYPTKVKLDMLYKDQYWQCVPHIPELDVWRVVEESKKIKITNKNENKRNLILEDFVF